MLVPGDLTIATELVAYAGRAGARVAHFHDAHVVTTVEGIEIAVVTRFAVCGNAIAAAGELAVRIASVAIDDVFVVALLVHRLDVVTAGSERAIGIAAIAIDLIAVVTRFRVARDQVSARGDGAVGIASVPFEHIAVVASFAVGWNGIAARGEGAVGVAHVAVGGIGIVAHFGIGDDAIAAARDGAIVIAHVPVRHVAVVAIFRARDDAISASGRSAIGIAIVTVDLIAVITHLAQGDDPIAAGSYCAIGVAVVPVGHVAVVALLAAFDHGISAGGGRATDDGDVVYGEPCEIDAAIAIQVENDFDIFARISADVGGVHAPARTFYEIGVGSTDLNLRLHRVVEELPEPGRVCPASLSNLDIRAIVRRGLHLVLHGPRKSNRGFDLRQIDRRRNQILVGVIVVGSYQIGLPAIRTTVAARYRDERGIASSPFILRS